MQESKTSDGRKLRRARNVVKKFERCYPAGWPIAGPKPEIEIKRYQRAQAMLLAHRLSKP